jgi:phosphatidylinositol phosphate synthase
MNALRVFLSVVAAAFGSMAVYGLGSRHRDADADGKKAQLMGGAGDFVLHWFMWLLRPITALSIRLGVTADIYNWLGLALGAASGVFIARGHLEYGGWSLALSGVTDILDGRVSRATGKTSRYGDFIDSTLDRFIEVFLFLGFVVYFDGDAQGVLWSVAALSGSLLVSYTRARGESLGVDCTGGLMQRAERLVLVCLVCLTDRTLTASVHRESGTAVVWVLGFLAITSFYTAVYRTVWISIRLRENERGRLS